MTKRDFQLIADVVSQAVMEDKHRKLLAEQFVEALQRTNDRFDTYQFLKACGVLDG